MRLYWSLRIDQYELCVNNIRRSHLCLIFEDDELRPARVRLIFDFLYKIAIPQTQQNCLILNVTWHLLSTICTYHCSGLLEVSVRPFPFARMPREMRYLLLSFTFSLLVGGDFAWITKQKRFDGNYVCLKGHIPTFIDWSIATTGAPSMLQKMSSLPTFHEWLAGDLILPPPLLIP